MTPVKTKETRLSVRIPPALKDRLAKAAQDTGVDEPSIVRQCLEAFCAHVEMHGRITFPLTVGGQSPAPPKSIQRLELNEPATTKRK